MSALSRMCACFIKPLGWIPVLIINMIGGWSYFAYVVVLCFMSVHNTTERAIYLVFYHPFFFMFVFSYWKAILSSPGTTPRKFYLTREDRDEYENSDNPQEILDSMARNLPIVTKSIMRATRFCDKCFAIKPDRSHHCSACGSCILRMDHHCPWINNCVGFKNYKYFVLFLFYSILYTMYCAFTSLKYFIQFWSGHHMKVSVSLHVLFLFFVAAMFCLSLWSLFGFHLFLVSKNRTTLESFRAPLFAHGADKNGFNIGFSNNIYQIFGNQRWKWFLPIFSTPGNGVSFPMAVTQEPESQGLLATDDHVLHVAEETDILLEHEAPTAVSYVNQANGTVSYVNQANGSSTALSQTKRDSFSDDSNDEDVEFDLNKFRKKSATKM